jgi:hypothetical protein
MGVLHASQECEKHGALASGGEDRGGVIRGDVDDR